MKRYFQEGFRDLAGDVFINQYAETYRPSGLVLPNLISTVSIESQVSTEELIELTGQEFYYEPEPSTFGFAEVTEIKKELRFSVGPQAQEDFCRSSAQAIADAFRALTYAGQPPRVEFTSPRDFGEFADDDRRTLQTVAELANAIVNDRDQSPFLGGQYL